MIFVTVGTHEQPFNRLVEYIDKLKEKGKIEEEVIIQTGYSTYQPQYCEWKKLYPYQEMVKLVEEARIVITHGGPSSFIMPLQIGKTPIVVPRQYKFGEHVNDHQVAFVKMKLRIEWEQLLQLRILKNWKIRSIAMIQLLGKCMGIQVVIMLSLIMNWKI